MTTPTAGGAGAGQLVVHPDDLWPNGHNRVELHQDGKQTAEGQTTYFSWYFQLPVNVTPSRAETGARHIQAASR